MTSPVLDIQLVSEPPDVGGVTALVQRPDNGGIATFVGTVRDQTRGRAVIELEFEAYAPMALRELTKIARTATERFQLNGVAIHHFVGLAPVGTVVVVIAASAPHRQSVFAACQYCIDTLKQTVPIWKKERFADGEVWVSATP